MSMEPPSEPEPPRNQWPWVVGSAIVIAGLLVAIALYSSRSHRVETVYVTPSAGGPPATVVASPSASYSASPGSGTSSNSADSEAQQNLDQAAAAARSIYSTTGSLLRANSLGLAPGLPSLTFVPSTTSSTGADNLSLAVTTTTWSASALSKSGTCWWIKFDSASSATTYGSGDTCTGQASAAAAAETWPGPSPAGDASPSVISTSPPA